MHRLAVLVLGLAVLLLAASVFVQPTPKNSADEWLERGIKLARSDKYDEAIRAFERAAQIAPKDLRAYLFIASAYMSRYRPGDDSRANLDLARKAEAALIRPLAIDPWNRVALASMASLKLQQAEDSKDPTTKIAVLEEAERWYKRLVEADPTDIDALSKLGFIASLKVRHEDQRARATSGMNTEEQGPIRDANARVEFTKRTSATVQEGIGQLRKAIEVDPRYEEAITDMNLLLRLSADGAATPGEYQKRIAEAETWTQRALEAKKAKAAGNESKKAAPSTPSKNAP